MAKRKRTPEELMILRKARETPFYEDNDMLQLGKFDLTATEQNIIAYAATFVDKNDTQFQEYTFTLREFYDVCGIRSESYTKIKKILDKLTEKAWFITCYDEKHGKGESKIHWFEVVRLYEKKGKVTVAFHRDMMKYLLRLHQRWEEEKKPYTEFILQYLLPLKSKYGKHLYQLLKSILGKDTQCSYWFYLDRLKRSFKCEHYERYADFRRYVLVPAIKEINKFTDISVSYDIHGQDGKRITSLIFFVVQKTEEQCIEAKRQGNKQLDGQMSLHDEEEIQRIMDWGQTVKKLREGDTE